MTCYESECLIQKEIVHTFWRIHAFLCNDIRLTEANKPTGSLPAPLSLEKEACDSNEEIKEERRDWERKGGSRVVSQQLQASLSVKGNGPSVHQITLILRRALAIFSRRNKTKRLPLH